MPSYFASSASSINSFIRS
ncbi:hypothetical protein [Alkalihalophilus marmarensis]